jgi:glutathione S-transferase
MKLYFAPGACSLSPHIVLRELGLPFELIKVNLGEHKTQDGEDFKSINPKGYVPALKTDEGKVLTEGVAINQYLADRKPEKKLAPANGTFERYELQEWLNFISTEVHKTYSPMFNSALPDAARAIFMDKLKKRFGEINTVLETRDFVTGSNFTIADAYLYTVLRWAPKFQVDLKQWPALAKFYDRVDQRPAVKAAVEAEAAAKVA